MSDDIKTAFSPPLARAEALATERPLDRISVRDHVVEIEIGAFQAERDLTQRISFNVVVEVYPLDTDVADDVDRILSYDRITESIATELSSERLNLLETLAERVADRILAEPQAHRVFVRIEKLDRGPFTLGVEIVRDRTSSNSTVEQDSVRPRLVFASNAVTKSADFVSRVDQLIALGNPVIICLGLPELPRPVAQGAAGHRIDLLAIEQNAWSIAVLDDRYAVVATRTELDWGMKNDQVGVWAPSKLVLDAVDGPVASSGDGFALAKWLANELDAVEVLALECAENAP